MTELCEFVTYQINRPVYKTVSEVQASMEAAWRLIDAIPPRYENGLIRGYPEDMDRRYLEMVVNAEKHLPGLGALTVIKRERNRNRINRPDLTQFKRPSRTGLDGFRSY